MHTSLSELSFDNSLLRGLPVDESDLKYSRQVLGACASRVAPTPVADPKLIALSAEMARELELDLEKVDRAQLAKMLSGNDVAPDMQPYAACYGGHQFGNWAGQLGDGRAISLGEVVTSSGARWELQLKGAGPTPYSRGSDGRAVMRSSVREFVCSEAMFHLGIATTRALSLVSTGDKIERDMFYDGNPAYEPGAIVCRVAPSFLRFGSFEILASRNDAELLKRLADYTITTHFPHLGTPSKQVYLDWLSEVCERTAEMILGWMRVGFVHGVMNTDNMSVLGLTIDYGPYGWLEGFDPNWTPNTTDASGRRYRFGSQPNIGWWNLVRFAEALYPLVDDSTALEGALDKYGDTLREGSSPMMSSKLGVTVTDDPEDKLAEDLLTVLQLQETDMTIFYRNLVDVPTAEDATDAALLGPIMDAYYSLNALRREVREKTVHWLRQYTARVRQEGRPDSVRREEMNASNPKYVMRNYLAQLAIDKAEEGDGTKVEELLDVMRKPYDDQPGREEFAAKRPEWARHRPGCSMLSCSS